MNEMEKVEIDDDFLSMFKSLTQTLIIIKNY